MNKILSALFAFFVLLSHSQAQNPKSFVEKSDPDAVKTLNKLRDKYKTYKSMRVDYSLLIENGDEKETQQGKISQKGDKFRVINQSNEMICDSKNVWLYTKKQNEVQITEFEPDSEELLSPSKMMSFYENEKKFICAITDRTAESESIEFKPLDKSAEYSKMRVKISKTKNEPQQIKVFMKDGSRYTLDIKKIENAEINDNFFIFDKSQYPNVRVTDLR